MKQQLLELVNNPKYKLILTYEYRQNCSFHRDKIVGWVNDEFATQVTAQYENLFGTGFQSWDKPIAQLKYATDNFWGMDTKLFGPGGVNRIKTVHQTVNYWSGSTSPEWAISFVVPRLKMSEPPVHKRVRNLQKVPMADHIGSAVCHVWEPTKSMARNPDAIPKGTSSLQIGEWLHLYGLLLTNVSVTFSKEVVKDGSPLYAMVTVSFMPWRFLFSNDVDRWYS